MLPKTKLYQALVAGVGLAFASGIGGAQAAAPLEPLLAGGLNVFIDDSGEDLEDRDGDGFLGVGDSLYGMFEITTIRNFSGGLNDTLIGDGTIYNELTGVFANRVQSLAILADPDGSCNGVATCDGPDPDGAGPLLPGALTGDEDVAYVFEPDPLFDVLVGLPGGTFSTDSMVAFFEDGAQNFDLGAATIGTATDGILRLEAGLPGTDGDEQWTATGSSNPSAGDTLSLATVLATFNVDLTILFESFGGDFEQVAATAGLGLDDGLIDLHFSGSVSGTGTNCNIFGTNCATNVGEGFPLFNQTTINVNYIPEPGTLGMLGLGLLALGFAARRRRFA